MELRKCGPGRDCSFCKWLGAGDSNLGRVSLLRPNILKIDRSLLQGVHMEFHRQVAFKSLVNLAQHTGALVVAEGVEHRAEALAALELGADLLQGYYFAHPLPLQEAVKSHGKRITGIAADYQKHMVEKIQVVRARDAYYERLMIAYQAELSRLTRSGFEVKLREMVRQTPSLECAYILDNQGLQVSETICDGALLLPQMRAIFQPACKGTNHAFKEYYYLLVNTGIERYTTDPYISLASGNLCVTISAKFQDALGRQYILCMDVLPE